MFGKKPTSIKIICPQCNNETTMTYLENYNIEQKNENDQWHLNNTADLISPDMEKALYDICKEIVTDTNPKMYASISSIGKHRIGGLFSKPCLRSEKICKVFSYYFIDHSNQTGGFTFRLIEEMLPATSWEHYGKLKFVSKNEMLTKEVNELMKNGYYEDVVKIMNKELLEDPINNIALFNKGDALSHLEYYVDAIACYDKVLETQPTSHICLISKGVALRHLNRYDEAIACYDKALEIEPHNADALSSKGVALRHLNRYDEAIACYDKALEIESGDFKIWINKGNALHALKKYEDAIACYDKALNLEPNEQFAIQMKIEIEKELAMDKN